MPPPAAPLPIAELASAPKQALIPKAAKLTFNPFSILPPELAALTLFYLDATDLLNASLVSKDFARWAKTAQKQQQVFWQKKVYRHFPHKIEHLSITPGINWETTYTIIASSEYSSDLHHIELFTLVKESNIKKIKEKIKNKNDLVTHDVSGISLLHWAIYFGQKQVLDYFYELFIEDNNPLADNRKLSYRPPQHVAYIFNEKYAVSNEQIKKFEFPILWVALLCKQPLDVLRNIKHVDVGSSSSSAAPTEAPDNLTLLNMAIIANHVNAVSDLLSEKKEGKFIVELTLEQVKELVNLAMQYRHIKTTQALFTYLEKNYKWHVLSLFSDWIDVCINTYVDERTHESIYFQKLLTILIERLKCSCQLDLAKLLAAAFNVKNTVAIVALLQCGANPFTEEIENNYIAIKNYQAIFVKYWIPTLNDLPVEQRNQSIIQAFNMAIEVNAVDIINGLFDFVKSSASNAISQENLNDAVYIAASQGHFSLVRLLKKQGANINAIYSKEINTVLGTALYNSFHALAARKINFIEIIHFLLKKKVIINKDEIVKLIRTLLQPYLNDETVIKFQNKAKTLRLKYTELDILLYCAVVADEPNITRILLNIHSNVNMVLPGKENLLFLTLAKENSLVKNVLLAYGVEIKQENSEGRTPLYIWTQCWLNALNNHQIQDSYFTKLYELMLFLENGAAYKSKSKLRGEKVFSWFAKFLGAVAKSAAFNRLEVAKNFFWADLLCFSVQKADLVLLNLLISLGVDVNSYSREGRTAIMLAENPAIVKRLQEAGAKEIRNLHQSQKSETNNSPKAVSSSNILAFFPMPMQHNEQKLPQIDPGGPIKRSGLS
jgi:ankyrin repeat protein